MRQRPELKYERRASLHAHGHKPFRPVMERQRMLLIANQIRRCIGLRQLREAELFRPGAYSE